MLARELISDEIPHLTYSDNGEKALQWMEDYKLTEMPLVEGSSFLGLISETAILDQEILDKPLKSLKIEYDNSSVSE
jgi:predicted transcriptional regulator